MIRAFKIFAACPALALFIVAGCSEPQAPAVLFQDSFNYAAVSPWTPVNGWSEVSGGSDWNIVSGGVSGNALQYNIGDSPILIDNFSGGDYTISVRVKPLNLIGGGWPFGIVARYGDVNNFYYASAYDDGSDIFIRLDKFVGGVQTLIGSEVQFGSGHLDQTTWYTLTFTCSGNNLSATLAGGGTTAGVSGTAGDFSSGKTGLRILNGNAAYDLLFDNYTVTGP